MKKLASLLALLLLAPAVPSHAQGAAALVQAARGKLKRLNTVNLPSPCYLGQFVFDLDDALPKFCVDGTNWSEVSFTGGTVAGATTFQSDVTVEGTFTYDDLTAGRVVIVGTGGLITDDAGIRASAAGNSISLGDATNPYFLTGSAIGGGTCGGIGVGRDAVGTYGRVCATSNPNHVELAGAQTATNVWLVPGATSTGTFLNTNAGGDVFGSSNLAGTAETTFKADEVTTVDRAGRPLGVEGGDALAGTVTNGAGGNLNLRSGQGTGNAASAPIVFEAPVPGASGTGAQSYAEIGRMDATNGARFRAGSGTGTVKPSGAICKNSGLTTTTTGTSEEAVATCSIPAGTVEAGDRIEITATGVSAANNNNKTISVRLGASGSCATVSGTLAYTTAAVPNLNNLVFFLGGGEEIRIIRTTTTTYASSGLNRYWPKGGSAAVGSSVFYADDTETVDWAVDQEVCITFTTATAAGGLTLNAYAMKLAR